MHGSIGLYVRSIVIIGFGWCGAYLQDAYGSTPDAGDATFPNTCICIHCSTGDRWPEKTDSALPPAKNTTHLTPSDIFKWSGPSGSFDADSARIATEQKWYEVTGKVTLVKLEADGDIHVQLSDVGSKTGSPAIVVEFPAGPPWCGMRAEVLSWTNVKFPVTSSGRQLELTQEPTVTVTGRAFYDFTHASGDTSSNKRDQDESNEAGGRPVSVWEIHPVMSVSVAGRVVDADSQGEPADSSDVNSARVVVPPPMANPTPSTNPSAAKGDQSPQQACSNQNNQVVVLDLGGPTTTSADQPTGVYSVKPGSRVIFCVKHKLPAMSYVENVLQTTHTVAGPDLLSALKKAGIPTGAPVAGTSAAAPPTTPPVGKNNSLLSETIGNHVSHLVKTKPVPKPMSVDCTGLAASLWAMVNNPDATEHSIEQRILSTETKLQSCRLTATDNANAYPDDPEYVKYYADYLNREESALRDIEHTLRLPQVVGDPNGYVLDKGDIVTFSERNSNNNIWSVAADAGSPGKWILFFGFTELSDHGNEAYSTAQATGGNFKIVNVTQTGGSYTFVPSVFALYDGSCGWGWLCPVLGVGVQDSKPEINVGGAWYWGQNAFVAIGAALAPRNKLAAAYRNVYNTGSTVSQAPTSDALVEQHYGATWFITLGVTYGSSGGG